MNQIPSRFAPRAARDRVWSRAARSAPALIALALLGAGTTSALAQDLDVEARGRDTVQSAINPANDVDRYTVFLSAGDRLKVKMVQTGPAVGLLGNLRLELPTGGDAGVTVKNQDRRNPQFDYTAVVTGLHVVQLKGDPGGQAGSIGNYKLKLKAKRGKPEKTTFSEAAGGSFVYQFTATQGARINVTAKTKKGGLDFVSLTNPGGGVDAGFLAAVSAKSNRRSAKAKKYAVTGANGTYVLRGDYDAGSSVKVAVKVQHDEANRTVRLTDDEPRFDLLFRPFPSAGIVGTLVDVTGFNFDFDPGEVDDNGRNVTTDDDVFPQFWVGNLLVPNDQILFTGPTYRFPVPAGAQPGVTYEFRVVNFDGQGAKLADAFTHALEPVATTLSVTSGGPGGGRFVEILGRDFHRDSIILFGSTVVQPSRVRDTKIDVTSPSRAPGVVDVSVRDVYGQVTTLNGAFTYLDVGTNAITDVSPSSVQALGGETLVVTGEDFGADSAFTLDGAPIEVERVSATEVRIVAPDLVPGPVELRVTDDLEQTNAFTLTSKGFTDDTVNAVPSPVTTSGKADGWRATGVHSGDFDKDGKLDLLLVRPEIAFGGDIDRPRVRLLLGNGAGVFTDATASKVPGVTTVDDWRARSATPFDLEGDGDLDFALLTDTQLDGGDRSSLRIWKNDGSGNFTDVTTQVLPGPTTYGDVNQGVVVARADIDGKDGDDLVILHTNFFTKVTVIAGEPQVPPDPDNPPEDTIITEYFPGIRIFLNQGNGTFARAEGLLPDVDPDAAVQYQGDSIAVGDVNDDGAPDIVVSRDGIIEFPKNSGTFVRTARLLINDGDGNFTDTSGDLPSATDPEYLQADNLILRDLTGDGVPELMCLSNTRIVSPVTSNVTTTPSLRIFINDGDGAFSAPAQPLLPGADRLDQLQCEHVAVGDLTGDGELDLLLISTSPPNAGERGARPLVRRNGVWVRASRAFPQPPFQDDGRGATVLLLDLDGDGDLDVVIGRDEANELVRNTRVLLNPRK